MERFSEIEFYNLITDMLITIGGKVNLSGFLFTKDAIMYMFKNNCKHGKLTTEVFPAVAIKNEVQNVMIQGCIRTFVNNIWNNGKREDITKVFKTYRKVDPPTIGEFLAYMVETLKKDFFVYENSIYHI